MNRRTNRPALRLAGVLTMTAVLACAATAGSAQAAGTDARDETMSTSPAHVGGDVVSYNLSVGVTGTRWGYVSGPGIQCPGDCSEVFAAGRTVWLAQNETMGDFVGWSGCDSVDGTYCIVKTNRARSVHATFRRAG